ncbi:heat-inducible transcriptional repressor HrcA [Pseudokineococcus sp. 1T1Z-3]|uniref:heat-inducible transcriptional repressor HrcA n=1 Tax=Pseudokineococcus sp. 1T1Z-3 TaxID=3132745 RepID=UPI0030A394B4
MSDERRLAVLRAIVEDYVATREPVGSKVLVERHSLGVSPATIRNDMAVLEEEGYIAQPHTSAGRVPTDKGYRAFVDRIATVKPLSPAERRAISTLLDDATDLDDVLTRTVRALAHLTRQVAVVQYPSLSRATVRHVELVPLGGPRMLLVLITDSGRVEQRTVEVTSEVPDELVARMRAALGVAAAGRRLSDVVAVLPSLPETFAPADRDVVRAVLRALEDSLSAEREERVVLAGTANLARSGLDFPQSISPVLEAIEEQVVLLRLLGEMAEDTGAGTGGVAVRIGRELAHERLTETSVVTSGYASGGQVVAHLGVLGPTRMDYPTTMAAVRAVARYVSRMIGG